MKLTDITNEMWWPQGEAGLVLQVFPEKGPQVARLRMNVLTPLELKAKTQELYNTLSLVPKGNDGVFFYFLKAQPLILRPGMHRPVLS